MKIKIIAQSSVAQGLESLGAPSRPLSTPAQNMSGMEVHLDGAAENKTGIWECTPGRFERQLNEAEVMHILTGVCTFTPTDGEPLAIKGGDTLFFPRNTSGVWEIQETLRKVYVVFKSVGPT
ncbi:DUF861 domain-containing protein [Pseudomonas syringae]|uniref:cupin domain-containing protein n=1 Tax=Pseudomonas syringae TaxID=317 RepID=UPI001F44FB69|nr:cupin domain-containing protein [Pseudomonas syringae]MCF5651461.1 DUF861 domain-containing protein [Pseudomonas syringae]